MRWLAKSAIQNGIYYLPRSDEINRFFKRTVSKRLPPSDPVLLDRVGRAVRHLRADLPLLSTDTDQLSTYEFGVGWDLVSPIVLWTAGVQQQLVVDTTRHVRLEAANHTLDRLNARWDEILRCDDVRDLVSLLGHELRRPPAGALRSLSDLRSQFGVTYRSPVDSTETGLADGSFDLVHSTDTLEHVPRSQMAPLLKECHRVLAHDGVSSHLIDLMDHYRYVDPSITVYNFLRFSPRTWAVLNSPFEHQNRLRLPEFDQLVDRAGFAVRGRVVKHARPDDLEWLANADLHSDFDDVPLADLGAKSVLYTLVKA